MNAILSPDLKANISTWSGGNKTSEVVAVGLLPNLICASQPFVAILTNPEPVVIADPYREPDQESKTHLR